MASELFETLQRLIAKYKREVHALSAPATPEAIAALEDHLGRELPPTLRDFYLAHDGADLLRRTVRIRKTSHVAIASSKQPQVVLFAETSGPVHWGYASDGQGGHAFGSWDGERLTAHHSTFQGWFVATIAVTEARAKLQSDRDNLRFEADPLDCYQLIRAGERALMRGQPGEAERWLTQASRHLAGRVAGLLRLGDALAIRDRSAARQAWLQAFQNVVLPLPWPGAPCLDPDVLRALAAAFSDPQQFERTLDRFLHDQVHDVRTPEGAAVVIATAEALARSAIRRGQRRRARDTLAALIKRFQSVTWNKTPWTTTLALARLEAELGHHDEAEALIRRLRKAGPSELIGPALLCLAGIAVTRQEPWAEDLLREAAQAGLSEAHQLENAALHIERALRLDRADHATRWLDKARASAKRLATHRARALLALVEGDVMHSQGQLAQAQKIYEKGLQLTEDPQLQGRLILRLGDVAAARRNPEHALTHYQQAAEQFATHELPVREAWALLRLARFAERPAQLIKAAKERFEASDMAAGMAALDAIRGTPGASLDWHLARATAQARARHDAQRSRPPWERADAERPERRLGAHQLAIARCDEAIVEVLSCEIESCARAMQAGRTRPTDPPVLRYIAALDLLSGHRSFAASQVLLTHLLNQPVTGLARAALQGAVARSPNAALVDGLLRRLEHPAEHPAKVVAEAAEILGLRRETLAIKPLLNLAGPGSNPIVRKAAITALGRLGDRSVVEVLVPALDNRALAEATALALLMLGDRRGVAFHAEALTRNQQNLSGSPGEIVGRYGGPDHLLLLRNAASGADDKALGALQGLGLLGDPRAIPTLLAALDHRDRRVPEVAAGALEIVTGHAEIIDNPGWKTRWNLWWEQHAERFPDGVRHRDGQRYEVGALLRKMQHPDAWVRRTSYDELVITSGHALPFDADGPWRLQQAHLDAWSQWWQTHRATLLPGRWYLDGQQVG